MRKRICSMALVCLLLISLTGCQIIRTGKEISEYLSDPEDYREKNGLYTKGSSEDPNIPQTFIEKEEYPLGTGFQDYASYCKFVYGADEFKENANYEVVTPERSAQIRKYFKRFQFQNKDRLDEDFFEDGCVNEGDYVRIETESDNYENVTCESYTVYFVDRETNTLYFIHDDDC